MLPTSIDCNERFKFLTDTSQGYYLLFATSEMLSQRGGTAPLWHMECADQSSMDAALRWVEIRRDLWPAWGAMVITKGFPTFRKHLAKLMKKEPIEAVCACVVQKLADPCELALGQLLGGNLGVRTEIVYRHRFATVEARDRFFKWFNRNLDSSKLDELVAVGFKSGTTQLSDALDDIAGDPSRYGAASGARQEKEKAA